MHTECHKFLLTFQPRSSGGFGAQIAASVMEHEKLHEERCHSRQPHSPASYTSSVGVCMHSLPLQTSWFTLVFYLTH